MSDNIIYETNVTNIPNINILFRTIQFENEKEVLCYFLKGEKKRILLVCILDENDNMANTNISFKEIKVEIIFNRTAKYNFRIQPGKLTDYF